MQNSDSVNYLNPTLWSGTLQQAVDSRHGDRPHQYIVKDRNGNFSLTTNPRSDEHKLTIREIVEITKANLEVNVETKRLLAGTSNQAANIDQLAETIRSCTKELIEDRAAKRAHSSLRKTAKFFCVIGCAILIGIPFYIRLVNGDKKFKSQTDSLKAEVDQSFTPQASESLREEKEKA